jgi:hypothetical protein
MTHWILQRNLTNAHTLETIKAALEEGHISYEEVYVIPFSDEVPVFQQEDGNLLFYGSTTLILNAHAHSATVPNYCRFEILSALSLIF